MEDGVLCELHSEHNAERKLTETVFLGRVEQIRPAFNAAFVDIGLHDDGLVHISKMTKEKNVHPSDLVSVGDLLKVKVHKIDKERKRVQLSLID